MELFVSLPTRVVSWEFVTIIGDYNRLFVLHYAFHWFFYLSGWLIWQWHVLAPTPPPGNWGAFARLVSPGGGALANLVRPVGRALANLGGKISVMSTGRLHVLLRICSQTQNVAIELYEPEIENKLNRLQAVIHELGKIKSYVNLTLSWMLIYEFREVRRSIVI